MERLKRVALALLSLAAMLGVLAASASAAEPIKIGFSISLTGGLAGGSKSALLAFQIWRDEINEKGGLLGRPVDLVYYADQSNPSTVPGIYTKLLDVDKVDLVVSSYGTNLMAPAMPIVVQRGLVFFGLFGTGVNDPFDYPRYFQILPNGTNAKLAPSLGFLETAMTMNPKPQTIALAAADAEFAQNSVAGARETVNRLGLKIVYDRSYPPNTTDFAPIIRAIQAAEPDVVYIASYPPDSVGMVRAANEVGLKAKMFGGGMIGLAFTPIKQQLGHLLNGIVAYDVYEPEPTMKFPGVEAFLARYQERAAKEGADPLGYFLPPFAYAEMQILADAITQVGSLDQAKIADFIHQTTFHTIVGDAKFAANGEWEKSRILFVQYRDIKDNDVAQFRQAGKQVILYPPQFKSGDLIYPYSDIKR
ncbi:MAG: amino acid ABC transporter substrate-binding protein [Roseiarcus sp.]